MSTTRERAERYAKDSCPAQCFANSKRCHVSGKMCDQVRGVADYYEKILKEEQAEERWRFRSWFEDNCARFYHVGERRGQIVCEIGAMFEEYAQFAALREHLDNTGV